MDVYLDNVPGDMHMCGIVIMRQTLHCVLHLHVGHYDKKESHCTCMGTLCLRKFDCDDDLTDVMFFLP